MAPLAAAAGLSRAALYLYFANREEVLFALYLEETRAWLEDHAARTGADMAVDDYLRAVFTTATRRPLFLALAPRVSDVIEPNVSIESLTESKRMAATLVDLAGRRTALALGRPVEQGVELAMGLFALLIGVTQTSRTPDVDVTRLPPDVRQLLEGEEPVEVFVRLGGWLVNGSC
jgi:AcrR family transcriptional regulator